MPNRTTYTRPARRAMSASVAVLFFLQTVLPATVVSAQTIPQTVLNLPATGVMVGLSAPVTPVILKGVMVNPDNPLSFNFIIDTGNAPDNGTQAAADEALRVIKYFLAALTIPSEHLWVNLSPYEQDRIIPRDFGFTEMGRDLLAQDYLLKQLTSSLLYPENELGAAFWKRVYAQAYERYGTTEIPLDTFNKVWIVPDRAVVYEHDGKAIVVKSHMKVLLEEDYKAREALSVKSEAQESSEALHVEREEQEKKSVIPVASPFEDSRELTQAGIQDDDGSPIKAFGDDKREGAFSASRDTLHERRFTNSASRDTLDVSRIQSSIIREIILPAIEKEINEGETFGQLRQIYQSLILAAWYKRTLRESLLGRVYADQSKVMGVDVDDPTINEKIYEHYLAAFKTGVYNFIKEEYDPTTQQLIPRKYFSGGAKMGDVERDLELYEGEYQSLPTDAQALISAGLVVKNPLKNFAVTMQEFGANVGEEALTRVRQAVKRAFTAGETAGPARYVGSMTPILAAYKAVKKFAEFKNRYAEIISGRSAGELLGFARIPAYLRVYENRDRDADRVMALLQRFENDPRECRLLVELGAGNTQVAVALAQKHAADGLYVLATDLWNRDEEVPEYRTDARMFNRGELTAQTAGMDTLAALRAEADILMGMPDSSVDYLLVVNPAVETLVGVHALYRSGELSRVLAPGGKVVVKAVDLSLDFLQAIEGESFTLTRQEGYEFLGVDLQETAAWQDEDLRGAVYVLEKKKSTRDFAVLTSTLDGRDITKLSRNFWNDFFGVTAGQAGVEELKRFLARDPTAYIGFGDMSKVASMDKAYHYRIVDMLIPWTIATVTDVLAARAIDGRAVRLGGDEIGLILPSALSPKEVNELRVAVQENVMSLISGMFGFGKIVIQARTPEDYQAAVTIIQNELQRTFMAGLYEDSDGLFMVFDRTAKPLVRSLEDTITVLNARLAAENMSARIVRQGMPIEVFSPKVSFGIVNAEPRENGVDAAYGVAIRRAEFVLNKAKEVKLPGALGMWPGIVEQLARFDASEATLAPLPSEERAALIEQVSDPARTIVAYADQVEPYYPSFKREELGTFVNQARATGPVTVIKFDTRYVPNGDLARDVTTALDAGTFTLDALRGRDDGTFGFKMINELSDHESANTVIRREAEIYNEILKAHDIRGAAIVRGPPDNFYVVIPAAMSAEDVQRFIDAATQEMNASGRLPVSATVRVTANVITAAEDQSPDESTTKVDQLVTTLDQLGQITKSLTYTPLVETPAGNFVQAYDPSPVAVEEFVLETAAIREESRVRGLIVLFENFQPYREPTSDEAMLTEEQYTEYKERIENALTIEAIDVVLAEKDLPFDLSIAAKIKRQGIEKGRYENITAASQEKNEPVGGIDFDLEALDLQIKRDGTGVPLPMSDQPIADMHIEGIVPIIINVTPVESLPLLLGVADQMSAMESVI